MWLALANLFETVVLCAATVALYVRTFSEISSGSWKTMKQVSLEHAMPDAFIMLLLAVYTFATSAYLLQKNSVPDNYSMSLPGTAK